MATKKGKGNSSPESQEKVQSPKKDNALSDVFFDDFTGAFTSFEKVPQQKRQELYGDKEYIEQFREYFKANYPNLLDKIDKEDLPIYIQTLAKKGFKISSFTKEASKLHNEFSDKDTEDHVMEHSLSSLQKFCEDTSNAVPATAFSDFARFAGFDGKSCRLDPDGKLRKVEHLLVLWNRFLEKEKITLGKTVGMDAERILSPEYNPTERIMVSIAITKIRKELSSSLRKRFDVEFPLPIDVYSSCRDLLSFKNQWSFFLEEHKALIDENLAKKLDNIMVTNGDIHEELLETGRDFDSTKNFSEWDRYYRRIFNKLVTRQLFEEVQKTQDTVDQYIETIGKTFLQFPSYVNDIFQIYPFHDTEIARIDPSFHTDSQKIDTQIASLQEQYVKVSDEEKEKIREQIRVLKTQKEQRRWQAYIAFLNTKDALLASVFSTLVAHKFDFSALSKEQQQPLVDVLVAHKLEDTIKNKVPELLAVSEEDLNHFVHDLFDLKKMNLTVPTRYGPVSLTFLKKEFMSGPVKELPAIQELEAMDIKNLPLNFETQLTETTAGFFEQNVIFDSLFTDFSAKNGKVRLNEAYKVKLIKNGKVVEGYLSPYGPLDDEKVLLDPAASDGKELCLYSEPITAPNQERSLVTREGTSEGTPVVIKNDEQSECQVEVLDKKINLNGDAFGALLFGYVVSEQALADSLSPQEERALGKNIGRLQSYREKDEEMQEAVVLPKEQVKETTETTELDKLHESRKQLAGYGFPEEQYKKNGGFVEGSRLFLTIGDSGVPPEQYGKSWMQMEIITIDEKKGSFKVKLHGGESLLGKYEGVTKELPLSPGSLDSITSVFGAKLYKLPSGRGVSFDEQLKVLSSSNVGSDAAKLFSSLEYSGSGLKYILGDHKGKEITHFGLYEPKAMNESVDAESGRTILYKIKFSPQGMVTLSGDKNEYNYARTFPERSMDYATFMLFIQEKKLQPKCEDQIKSIYQTKQANEEETPTTVRRFSINNVVGFFKNATTKLKDGIKKYDEERTEDLIDLVTDQGNLWMKMGGLLSPFSRISSSFETMGREYFAERDSRVAKKVDKWVKYYEDYDYTKLYNVWIRPMLDGKIKVVPHYKIAALLLVNIKKAKGPYGKHPTFTNEGKWIGKLLGQDHQQRYLAMREKRIRDLEQNAAVNGGGWADQVKNELVELEMRYIVHVMDARHMGMGDDVKYYFQNKYSKKFCDDLEGAYTSFYKQDGVEEGFTKNKDANFEFARVEYFRQLADRPQQALPYLKVMATKAINDSQWEVFNMAVLAGMLSGVFLDMTFSSTQKFVQKICRTRGFALGIFAKDINQQTKVQRILDLFSGGNFSKATGFSASDFSYRTNLGAGEFINKKFTSWIESSISIGGEQRTVMSALSKFLDITGKNVDNKNLLDIYGDPTTAPADRLLIKEFIGKTNEKNEPLDDDVADNTSSLTGSILTKSQSVVDKMVSINKNGFAGKNDDAIQNMRAFSENMKSAIPEGKQSSETVKFFVGKFFNWFESGFPGIQKMALLQRLRRCATHKGSPDTEDMLYYSIVGKVLSSVASGEQCYVPDELHDALNAWKKFFASNLDTILSPALVSDAFGVQYVDELSKPPLVLEPRDSASYLLDADASRLYMQTLDSSGRKVAATKKSHLNNGKKYLNRGLYLLAEQVEKQCSGLINRFRRDPPEENRVIPHTKNNGGAKIKNPEVAEKVRRILQGKPVDEEEDDAYLDMEDYEYPMAA